MGLFGFLSSELLKVLEWADSSNDTIVYRFPMEGRKIKCGSSLTVRESQVAIFVNNGKIADIFTPGRYKLNTSSLPILTTLLSLPYGFKNPFTAEVYFINTKQFTNQKWGTPNPIILRDKDFGTIRVKGFGTYSFRVKNPEILLKELFGTNSTFKTNDIIDYLKSFLVSGISDTIAESKISALDLSANLMEFNEAAKNQIGGKFNEIGLELVNLICENFSFPEEVEKAIDQRTSMGVLEDTMDTYVKYQAANAMRDAANNQNGGLTNAGIGLGTGVTLGKLFNETMNQSNEKKSNERICSSCNFVCDSKAKFCPNCGKNMLNNCPECGTKIEGSPKFCANCGHKL